VDPEHQQLIQLGNFNIDSAPIQANNSDTLPSTEQVDPVDAVLPITDSVSYRLIISLEAESAVELLLMLLL